MTTKSTELRYYAENCGRYFRIMDRLQGRMVGQVCGNPEHTLNQLNMYGYVEN